jgi:MFS family permease
MENLMATSTTPATTLLPRDFWIFWIGQVISTLGSSFTTFALPLLVYKQTNSAVDLGLVSVAGYLPYLFFGLLIGAWVDRTDRRRLMIGTDIAQAAVIASLPLLATQSSLPIGWIYVVSFLASTLAICFAIARSAIIPSLVGHENLLLANSRIQASAAAAGVVGPLIAGLLVTLLSPAMLLFFDAVSFLISALALAVIRTRLQPAEARPVTSLRQDIAAGLAYLWGHPVLRTIALAAVLINLVDTTVNAQLVLFAKQHFAATDLEVSLLYTAGSIGIVSLLSAAGAIRKRLAFSQMGLGALMLHGILVTAMALVPWYPAVLPIWGLAVGLGALFNLNVGILRQSIVPSEILGRTGASLSVLAMSSAPVGIFLGSLVIAWTQDVAAVYATSGVLIVLIGLGFIFTPLGHAERYLPPAESPTAATA